ncbi:hypothetical protein DV515_00011489 [Chloebia gouldiae]|uniref:Uncharacterized protein n=1 Tax=Chloebia gouldiae TaxID=44316 RepID=A0A3L8S7U6_CHLGU|nr:hypothetical protein DV515_00011489 [Chloebia gouldiae]
MDQLHGLSKGTEGILARCQNAPLPLRVESVAQLFPVLICQAWSDCRAYFRQLKRQQEREWKAGLSVAGRCCSLPRRCLQEGRECELEPAAISIADRALVSRVLRPCLTIC